MTEVKAEPVIAESDKLYTLALAALAIVAFVGALWFVAAYNGKIDATSAADKMFYAVLGLAITAFTFYFGTKGLQKKQ